MSRLILIELKLLLRGWEVVAGIVLLVVAGGFGIVHGRNVIADQRAVIAQSRAIQTESHNAILAPPPLTAEAGDQLYYLFFHTVREPSAWAPVAVGQRDVQPFNLKVSIRALQAQLYDAEIGNPLLAALGNFDLAFVFVVLSPLLVIAITYNVWSAERESGTWDLVRSQPIREGAVLARKFALRTAFAWLPLIILQVVATVVADLPLDARWWTVAGSLLLYVMFWVVVAIAVMTLRQSSDVNMLLLLGLWLICAVLGPALVNVAAAARHPLPEAMELTVLQRQGYHSAWDRPLSETMEEFYARYPEWRASEIPTDRYSNGWYYAMQQRGDEAARPAATRYRASLVERDRWIARLSWLFPPAVLQRALTRIARTDLDSYLAYLDSVAGFHEALKRHFFPAIFSNASLADVDWSDTPVHRHYD